MLNMIPAFKLFHHNFEKFMVKVIQIRIIKIERSIKIEEVLLQSKLSRFLRFSALKRIFRSSKMYLYLPLTYFVYFNEFF